MMVFGLSIIFLLVLLLPLTVRIVEKNLEMFLFMMGLGTAITYQVMDRTLFLEAALSPVPIAIAVLIAGVIFKWMHTPLENSIIVMSRVLPFKLFLALIITVLGLVASVITAIIAALVLVFITSVLSLERKEEIRFIVVACFAIGLGASLTPVGEPLSTIAISKLNEDFLFLFRLIGKEVIVAILALAIFAGLIVKTPKSHVGNKASATNESYLDILNRALKIYFFVMGLTFLGAGFEPMIHQYIIHLDSAVLYWINIISAILDNATLTAAEISSDMDHDAVRAIILGLIISGGMLIPGNIPNIIAAGKRGITSKEWLKEGLPLGLVLMVVFFFFL